MKRKIPTTGVATLEGGISIALLDDGTPPSEFRIFRAGTNASDYGEITFDAKAAQSVMAAQEKKGNPLFFDWNHGMTIPKELRTREQGESAGRFSLELREGELWAVKCAWNDAGAESLKKRTYELFSPYFATRTDEDGVLRPTKLMNCALTNLAGLDHLEPIAAEADLTEGDHMDAIALQAALDKANGAVATLTAEITTLKAKDSSRGVLMLSAALGLAGDVSDELRVSAVRGLVKVREDVLLLTAKTTDAEAIGVLRAWKGNAEEVAAIRAEAASKATLALTAEFDGIVETAVKELKVDPAKKDAFRASELKKMGGAITAEGVAEVKTLVELMNPKGNVVGRGPVTPATGAPQEITAEQKSFLALHGVKPETAQRALDNERLFLEAKATKEGRTSA